MPEFREQIFDAIQTGVCTMLSAGATTADFFGIGRETLVPGFPPFPNIPGLLHRNLCQNNPPPPPPPPFNGGQCPVFYQVSVTWKVNQFNPFTGAQIGVINGSGGGRIAGPIGSITVPRTLIDNGATAQYVATASNANTTITLGTVAGASNSLTQPAYDVIISVTREDGQPDSCGSPPPPGPPPGWNIRPFNFTYSPVTGPSVEINGNITLNAPTINIDGKIIAPVSLNFIDPSLNVDVEIGAEIDLITGDITLVNNTYGPNGGPPAGGGEGPRPPGQNDPFFIDPPPDGAPPGSDPDGNPPPPSGDSGGDEPPDTVPPTTPVPQVQKLVGVVVMTRDIGTKQGEIFDDDGPDLIIPDLGRVVFQYTVAGIVCYSEPIPVNFKRQFVKVPLESGADDVKFIERPGVSVYINKVYDSRSLPIRSINSGA